jgi:hypothetical protein
VQLRAKLPKKTFFDIDKMINDHDKGCYLYQVQIDQSNTGMVSSPFLVVTPERLLPITIMVQRAP